MLQEVCYCIYRGAFRTFALKNKNNPSFTRWAAKTRRALKDNRPPHGPDTTDPSSAESAVQNQAQPRRLLVTQQGKQHLLKRLLLTAPVYKSWSNLVLSAARRGFRFKRSTLPGPLQIPSPRFLASLLFILSWYIRQLRCVIENKQYSEHGAVLLLRNFCL